MADVCFVVDSSGSIRDMNPDDRSYDNWGLLKKFIINVTDAFDIGSNKTRVGLVKFSTKAHLAFSLNQYTDSRSLSRAIQRLHYSGGRTNTSGGINVMRRDCFGSSKDRYDVPNIAFIITDGLPTVDSETAVSSAEKAMKEGISVFSVGITTSIDEDFLRDISSNPKLKNRSWFEAVNFRSLSTVLDNIIDFTCVNKTAISEYEN